MIILSWNHSSWDTEINVDFNSEDYAAASDYSKGFFLTDMAFLKDTVPGPYPYVPHTQLGHFSVLKVLDSFETQLKSSKKHFRTVWHGSDKKNWVPKGSDVNVRSVPPP